MASRTRGNGFGRASPMPVLKDWDDDRQSEEQVMRRSMMGGSRSADTFGYHYLVVSRCTEWN
jgi:hypothetical protein